jgi:nicotinamidase/pyrazinamidase
MPVGHAPTGALNLKLEFTAVSNPAMKPSMPADTALIVVDVQPDFMPGGALACHQGDAIVPGIDRLLRRGLYRHVVATQDWHPAGHASFASSHPGTEAFDRILLHGKPQILWPDHCVQGPPGAALHPGIDWSAVDVVIRKGSRRGVDSYSGFRENHGPEGERPSTGLAGWLRDRGVAEVHVCGLARDVCVLWTAQDAVTLGFRASLLWDLSRPVTAQSDDTTRAALHADGIATIDTAY